MCCVTSVYVVGHGPISLIEVAALRPVGFWESRWFSPPSILSRATRLGWARDAQYGDPPMNSETIRVDLGCGGAKRQGYIGLDYVDLPGVDHVLDLTTDRYPFDDNTVDEVFSAHFLEHIDAPNHVFGEIGRICKDGAHVEFWTPYGFTNEAFLYGHLNFLTETPWMHFCVTHRDAHADMLGGRWLLHNINFVVQPEVIEEITAQGFSLDFAVRYFKGVVLEFGVEIEFQREMTTPVVEPGRTWSVERFGDRRSFTPLPVASGPVSPTLARRMARKLPAPVKHAIRKLVGSA